MTGDVQTASVIFYKTSVMVGCALAEGSTASGCLLVFTRFSDNGTENVTDRNPTGCCPQLTQTKSQLITYLKHMSFFLILTEEHNYAEELLVYAIAYNDSTVIQPAKVSVIDSVDTNNFTCVLEPSKNTVTFTTLQHIFFTEHWQPFFCSYLAAVQSRFSEESKNK